jgi:hypothetical protein
MIVGELFACLVSRDAESSERSAVEALRSEESASRLTSAPNTKHHTTHYYGTGMHTCSSNFSQRS